MDDLILLPEGEYLSPFITELTGITDEQLLREGVEQAVAVEHFCQLLEGAERPLLVAYNAQFDLNFLYHFLRPYGKVGVLRAPHFLDALTVYKDRRDYPHKLANAIDAYSLGDRVVNSHRAVDDARATVALLDAMSAERSDLEHYLDLFGTHPKYGVSGRKIASVTYRPQPYQRVCPLYERR
jgi:DNA polymerase-3 subunit epsilon